MNVLKDNYNENKCSTEDINQLQPYPRKLICERCQSELEYDKSDLRMGFLGCVFVDCPLCGEDNMLDENENGITLTVDNVEFPTHFYHTSKETGAKDCCNNEEIKKCITKAIKYFRENKDEYDWFTQYGNLCVGVYRWSGDEVYSVIVTNNYYGTEIPFEPEDY